MNRATGAPTSSREVQANSRAARVRGLDRPGLVDADDAVDGRMHDAPAAARRVAACRAQRSSPSRSAGRGSAASLPGIRRRSRRRMAGLRATTGARRTDTGTTRRPARARPRARRHSAAMSARSMPRRRRVSMRPAPSTAIRPARHAAGRPRRFRVPAPARPRPATNGAAVPAPCRRVRRRSHRQKPSCPLAPHAERGLRAGPDRTCTRTMRAKSNSRSVLRIPGAVFLPGR